MTIPKYTIKTPVYQYANSYYHIDILEGKYSGVQFNFSKTEIINDELNFTYNLLRIPIDVEQDTELEKVIGEILQDIIRRGNYELNTK